MTTLLATTETLRERWSAYRAEHKRVRIYDAAEALGVSEAELLATGCGDVATRLDGPWTDLLASLDDAGELMALTRNHWAVIEKRGHYRPFSANGHVALVLDEGIDLRIFLQNWRLGFGVNHPEHPEFPHSLHFFDGAGRAVHKVYFPATAAPVFHAIVERFQSDNQDPGQPVTHPASAAAPRPDGEIDAEALLSDWGALQDTHDFFGLLKKHGVARTQACRLAEGRFTRRLPVNAHREVFERAASGGVPIMVFAGNSGCIEIHTGPIHRLVEARGWYNIMDPGFNLHLKEDGIHEAWLVRKPTADGTVTAVELFCREGKDIIQIFGKRKPGIPELDSWREIAEGIKGL